jgi:hypothetical protein
MTIACLLFNTLQAACAQAGFPAPEIKKDEGAWHVIAGLVRRSRL